MPNSSKLRTFLWFNNTLEEALNFYISIFGDNVVIHSSGRPEADGKLMTAAFSIFGHEIIGMGWPGGPEFTDAISLSISCDGQAETDRLWEAITKDGKAGQCGWCKDPFGVSWQITPSQMQDYLEQSDPEKRDYAWSALRTMGKIVLKDFIKP